MCSSSELRSRGLRACSCPGGRVSMAFGGLLRSWGRLGPLAGLLDRPPSPGGLAGDLAALLGRELAGACLATRGAPLAEQLDVRLEGPAQSPPVGLCSPRIGFCGLLSCGGERRFSRSSHARECSTAMLTLSVKKGLDADHCTRYRVSSIVPGWEPGKGATTWQRQTAVATQNSSKG